MFLISSNNGIVANYVNPTVTGSSIGSGWTNQEYFNLSAYDDLHFQLSGTNRGNYLGLIYAHPSASGSGELKTAYTVPTSTVVNGGFVSSIPFDLRWSQSANYASYGHSITRYSGYSASGVCKFKITAEEGIPSATLVWTNYGSGVSAWSSIEKWETSEEAVTSGPYYHDVPSHYSTDNSALHVRVAIQFSGIKYNSSIEGIRPLGREQ